MKKTISFLLIIAFGFHALAQQAKHVVLITIDGFRPDYYLDPSWNTPNLAALLKQGTHAAGVTSAFPSMTYPSHTTIITGVWPSKHGVYFNGVFEPNGSTGKIYWNDSSIKVPTLWTAVQAKGMKSAALYWPVSADAPVTYNIPDNGNLGEKAREKYSKPEGFLTTVKKELFKDSPTIQLAHDYNIANIAGYLVKKDQPNLMLIHLFGVDHYSHQQGREGAQVQQAIHVADSAVGIIVKSIKDAGNWNNTVFIVTGDHGFQNVTTSVNPNVWLVKEGLITDVKKGEWKAQFYCVAGSGFLYLKDKNDSQTAAKVKAMLDKLPAEEKKYFRIIDRKQIDKVGGNPEAAFALSAENGGSLGNAMSGDAVKIRNKGGAHGHYPDFREIQTGLIVAGPGVRAGGLIQQMSLRDIAPFIAKVLELDLPTAEGKVPAALTAR